jgi:hypothetical protein
VRGHGIVSGRVEGVVLRADPLSFLGGVDRMGVVADKGNRAYGKSVKDKILVFPYGIGSTVGSYALYGLKKRGCAPRAIINAKAETIVAVGAVIAEIPMVDGISPERFADGDCVRIDGKGGTVEIICRARERPSSREDR